MDGVTLRIMRTTWRKHCLAPPDLAPPVVSGLKSKITSFWKIATQIEKEETNQHEFQKLRDDFEVKAADIVEGNRQKLARGRMQVRECQQAHHDRSKEKKNGFLETNG